MNEGHVDVRRTENRRGGEGVSNVWVLHMIYISMPRYCLVLEVYSPTYVLEAYSSPMLSKLAHACCQYLKS